MFCKTCSQEKPEGAFYVSNKTKCKDCIKASVNANRQENLEKIRGYDRMRGSMPHRVAARAEYAKTDAYSVSHDAAVRKWSAKHPDRSKATVTVNNAVRDKRLIPWPVCALHACEKRPQAHHPDYSRPLDVVWLCPLHHKQAHEIVRVENYLAV